MSKKLSTLSLEQLKSLYEKNQQFSNAVFESAYENNMFWQEEEWGEMLGKDNRGLECHDHYTSFYFILKDAEKFITNLPEHCQEYLSADAIEKYNTAKKMCDEWQEMTWEEQEENEEFYEKFEAAAVELMSAMEQQLHDFENVTDDDIEQVLQNILDGGYMSDWELLNDGTAILQHITKIYR